MSEIQDSSILNSYAICVHGPIIYIIMPLMNAGSLQSIINFKYPSGIKDECIIATIIKEMLKAIVLLNKNDLFHRDIKSANILLKMDGTIKLGDFGVSAMIKGAGRKHTLVGSYCWMAPEVINSEGYDTKVQLFLNMLPG
jgi:serine/threonine protein kinase